MTSLSMGLETAGGVMIKDNYLLGSSTLMAFLQPHRGVPQIEVLFDIDASSKASEP